MKNFKDFFDRLLGGMKIDNGSQHGNEKNAPNENLALGRYHKVGDFIGQKYEVYDVLGKGGFGVVYLVYSHETNSVYALKTFRDEYLQDIQTRERFKKEASIWIDLERHPYLVRAYFVDQISERLYIGMGYIAPDEQGLNSLEGYLRHSPPDFILSLRWAIQFCHGMEYAYSKGLRCHRDIKPANILISQDKTVKISDFGLAGVVDSSTVLPGIKLSFQKDRVGLSFQTLDGVVGTPTHMPPEQFINTAYCDERSDIYSFGIVLYQMRTGGKVPFFAPLPKDNSDKETMRFWNSMRRLHTEAPVPEINSRLNTIIYHCLEKEPNKRYQSFKELRSVLERLLHYHTGEIINPPQLNEFEAWEWIYKGNSLNSLGKYEDAILCFNKALFFNQKDNFAWYNKGMSLYHLGQYKEAIHCYNKCLDVNPQDAMVWSSKGNSHYNLGHIDEAIDCFDKAVQYNRQDAVAWHNKALIEEKHGLTENATNSYKQFIAVAPPEFVKQIEYARQRLKELEGK